MIRVRVIIKRATYFSIAFGALVFSFVAGYDIGCFVVFDVQFPNFLTTFSSYTYMIYDDRSIKYELTVVNRKTN